MQQLYLHTTDLSIGYGKRYVQRGLNLESHPGELICLLGPNGAGKSTLLRTISGLQPPLGGCVRVMGRDIAATPRRQAARLIAMVYTDRTLAGALTVRELVALGRQPHTGFFGRLDDTDRRIVDESMRQCGISGMANRMVAQLSDGERQKAMIARAIAQSTPLIVMDEPTAFLDVASRLEVMSLLSSLTKEHRKSILLSTHDVASAVAIADTLWLMRPGDGQEAAGGVTVGTPADLAVDPDGLPSLFVGRHIAFDPLRGDYRPL